MNTYEEFYEIDCDELDFPNLTTFDDIPNEIVAIIKDYKIKYEINDIYDKIKKEEEDFRVFQFREHIDGMKLKSWRKGYSINQTIKDYVNIQDYVDKYNQETGNNIQNWNKLDKTKSTKIKFQRDDILSHFEYYTYEKLKEWADSINSYKLLKIGWVCSGSSYELTDQNYENDRRENLNKEFWKQAYGYQGGKKYRDYLPYLKIITGENEIPPFMDSPETLYNIYGEILNPI